MKLIIAPTYHSRKEDILDVLDNFRNKGTTFGKGARNQIKLFSLGDTVINVKSFKIPNLVNKVVYRYFLKSKAQRSYENANYLIDHNIGTPAPVAYMEEHGLLFNKSFYISEHIAYDLTFRELIHEPEYPENEAILRAFTRFTFTLHQNNIEFLDHSPGNTLIQLNKGSYKFFLVDLNRMKFKKMSFKDRMKNFHRITPMRPMAEVIASEYSKLIPQSQEEVFEQIWYYIQQFQKKALRKKALKNKLRLKK